MKKYFQIIFGAILAIGLMVVIYGVSADLTVQKPAQDNFYHNYRFFSTSTDQTVYSTTTSATSTDIVSWFNSRGEIDNGSFVIAGADRVHFRFKREETLGGEGYTIFKVQVTPDGTNWYDFNKLVGDDVSSTATSTVTIGATSTETYAMDLRYDPYYAVRCIVVETTDGEHFCEASSKY